MWAGGAVFAALVCFSPEEDEHPIRHAADNRSKLNRINLMIRRQDSRQHLEFTHGVILNLMLRRGVIVLLAAALGSIADSGAGLRWSQPANWKSEAQRPMRLATYTIPHAPGDSENGECGVYYFGPGQGGSVQANLDRWIGQFLEADGKSSKSAAKLEKRSVHGLKISTVDVSGAYTGMGGPMVQSGKPVPGYRLLGAIVEGPQGSVFFKFTGPAKTVAQNQSAFSKMLDSLSTQ